MESLKECYICQDFPPWIISSLLCGRLCRETSYWFTELHSWSVCHTSMTYPEVLFIKKLAWHQTEIKPSCHKLPLFRCHICRCPDQAYLGNEILHLQPSHGTLCDRLRCLDLHRATSEIMVQLNLSKEKMVHVQDSIRSTSHLPYSLSSILLLGQGECILERMCNNFVLIIYI